MTHLLVTILWLVGGVAIGLWAANKVLKDMSEYGSIEIEDGVLAGLAFITCVAGAPIIAGLAVIGGVLWCGAWLLPVFRAEKRAQRTEKRWEAERAASRKERDRREALDQLHRELGLPPVDWEGRE